MNYKKIILGLAFLAVFIFAGGAKAATPLEEQIKSLMVQIVALQQQLVQLLKTQQSTIPAWCHTFNTNLKIEDSGAEVSSLARVLQKENLYVGQGESLSATFNEQVYFAVIAFQEKYASEILAPYGLKSGTGYIGKATRAKLNKLYGCNTTPILAPTPIPNSTATINPLTPTPNTINDPSSIIISPLVDGSDTTAPIISAVTTTGATITWTTNESSDTQVEYGTIAAFASGITFTASSPSMVINHSQTLSGLNENTTYSYRVKSRDGAGNLGVSPYFTFTTSNSGDSTLTISGVTASSITSTSATIIWNTTKIIMKTFSNRSENQPSDTQVEYGTTTSYGQSTTLNTSMVSSHSQTLSGLNPNTLYHYRVKSRDAEGSFAVSQDFTFTTLGSGVYSTNLNAEMTYQIDNRITGITADSSTRNLFTTRGDGTNSWVRNPNVWTARGSQALDLTGASPWVSYGSYAKGGALISPRHFVFANHAPIVNGATIIFVDKNNNIITRTLQNQQRIGTTDIQLGVLDSDVPSSIAYYPIISYSEVVQYLLGSGSTTLSPTIPILILDQEDKALIHDAKYALSTQTIFQSPIGARLSFYEPLVSGDSGDPGFFAINNKLALIMTLMGPTTGPTYGSYISELNQAMAILGGGYQVGSVNLSSFVKK